MLNVRLDPEASRLALSSLTFSVAVVVEKIVVALWRDGVGVGRVDHAAPFVLLASTWALRACRKT